jgi:signal transduction histidine kinase
VPPQPSDSLRNTPGLIPVAAGRTTRQWLRRGVATALAVFLILGVLAVWISVRSASVTDTLMDRRSPAVTDAVRLEAALINQETGIRGYGLSGQREFLQPYTDGVVQEQEAIADLRKLVAGDTEGIADLDRVVDDAKAWQSSFAQPVAAAAADAVTPLATERAADAKTRFDTLRSALATQQTHLQTIRDSALRTLRDVDTLREWVLTAIAAVILLLALLVVEGFRRGVTAPLAILSADARRVAQGDLDHPLTPTGTADLRQLGADVEDMRQRLVGELESVAGARRQLDEQAAALRRSNQELEQFAYVASHDLQEPLRKVAGFCQLLQRRYGDVLDARADQYIEYAVDGAHRMQALILDLLAFSRLDRNSEQHTDVDLEQVFAIALDALSLAVTEAGALVTHDPLPTVAGDSTQLGILFQNLISNAVKFREPAGQSQVHVTAARDGDWWSLAISDNGIGVRPEHAEKVFVMFQRLHSRESYPGNGIGLAICRRIVDLHGGTITVDADHSPGLRITFTLPASKPAAETVLDEESKDPDLLVSGPEGEPRP